jgi:hypothetical protein
MVISNKLLAVIIAVLLLRSCFFTQQQSAQQNTPGHTFFIQIPVESPVVSMLRKELYPVIATIIKEEAGLEQDKGFPLFFFKSRQAITLYYINDLREQGEPLEGILYLFVYPVLRLFKDTPAPQGIMLTSKLDFFGEEKPGLFATKELVVMLDDSKQELAELNTKTKTAVHEANQGFKRAYHTDLYDIAKSERHAYLPHLSIMQLRENYIKYLINDPAKADAAIRAIKQRIMQVVAEKFAALSEQERAVTSEKVALYDLEKRKFVEEVSWAHIYSHK